MKIRNFTHRYLNVEPGQEGAPPAPADPTPPVETPPATDDPTPAPADPVETPPEPVEPVSMFDNVPEDWRTQMVDSLGIEDDAEREKVEKMFSRVTDIKSLAKNYVEAQKTIRSGQKADTGLPENPTEEQLKEYREANGIPETPEGYELQLADGLVLGEDDNRIMGDVFKAAHEMNLPSEQINTLTNAMLQARQREEQAYIEQDGLDLQNAQRQLRENWGHDYQSNVNMIRGLMEQLPEAVRDDFMSARLPNGMAMFSSPQVANFFADMARKVNPSATVVPNSDNPLQSINEEIKKLEGKMGTDEWYKDAQSQKRYQDLVTARDRMK